jgi:hypothetical protein
MLLGHFDQTQAFFQQPDEGLARYQQWEHQLAHQGAEYLPAAMSLAACSMLSGRPRSRQ